MICDSAPGALLRNKSVPFYAYVVNVADDENTDFCRLWQIQKRRFLLSEKVKIKPPKHTQRYLDFVNSAKPVSPEELDQV